MELGSVGAALDGVLAVNSIAGAAVVAVVTMATAAVADVVAAAFPLQSEGRCNPSSFRPWESTTHPVLDPFARSAAAGSAVAVCSLPSVEPGARESTEKAISVLSVLAADVMDAPPF